MFGMPNSTTTLQRMSQATIEVRVRYSETDQMGVVYHANYLVWCEIGRTDLLRKLGRSYAGLETEGILLAVSEASLRYHRSARYDDRCRIRTTLCEVRSRRIVFDYEIDRIDDDGAETRLATARTALISIDRESRPRALPADLLRLLRDAAPVEEGSS
jgi:acyl-CoA thioester hydrolase